MKKREVWRLPKTRKHGEVIDGFIQRHDGEPVLLQLTQWENDRTLSTNQVVTCCNCGLTHNITYNTMKDSSGKWFLVVRSYRIPGTGTESDN